MTPQRILIVEDYADNADALALLLASDDRVVEVVGTGERAIVRGLHSRPHLIILDLGLPDMTGERVAKELRANGVTSFIVAYSGFHTREQEARDAGCDAFLLKPEVDALLALAQMVESKATG